MKKIVLILILSGLVPVSKGQVLCLQKNQIVRAIGMHIGADPELKTGFEYLQTFQKLKLGEKFLGLKGGFIIPVFTPLGKDYDLYLGSSILIEIHSHIKMISTLQWKLSRTADINGKFYSTGPELEFLPGYYGEHWIFAMHLALTYKPFIHLKHDDNIYQVSTGMYSSEDWKYYPLKNGWFYQDYFLMNAGICVAYNVSSWQMYIQTGYESQLKQLGIKGFPDIGMLPFYCETGIAYCLYK